MKYVLFLLSIFLLVGCKAIDQNDEIFTGEEHSILLILPERMGTNPFLNDIRMGLERFSEDNNMHVETIESRDEEQLHDYLNYYANEGYDLIVTGTYKAHDALHDVASEYSSQPFLIVDFFVDLPNVASITFQEQEASFLLGVLAGNITDTNVVGMVAAMDVPLLQKWVTGYELGVHTVNPDAKVLIDYVGHFSDPATAKDIAIEFARDNADFVAGAAAVGNYGVFEAAIEEGFYTAGQDHDQLTIDPEHILISQLKMADEAVYHTLELFLNETFQGKEYTYGLQDEFIGVTHITHPTNTPLNHVINEEILHVLNNFKEQIISKEIVIPNPLEDIQ
ncbi:BMP family protein [Halalkalibacter sp. APA_J-10(15)]|uniref:BMP family protein n=1 Tax=Halalkalibacter sp. APA_J-10(15) TaxID=2933805 RepID=UPI001FF3C5C5|nr:BMP family protein [Halalkalibacter sp. APA_J-10(15)]MCK0472009.1 BMP family protein [Halalkalibacter sp. APA_J-10(15)]